jgi:hypothetical protein
MPLKLIRLDEQNQSQIMLIFLRNNQSFRTIKSLLVFPDHSMEQP